MTIDIKGDPFMDPTTQTAKFTGEFASVPSQAFSKTISTGAEFSGGVQIKGSDKVWSYILVDRQTIATLQFSADGDKLTSPSASSVFIHETLDHGLDFINNRNTVKSSISGSPGGVYFHNKALENASNGESPSRNAKDHGN